MQGHIYFHSPCFDGIVSAVLISDYLQYAWRWQEPILHVVNYDLRDAWLTSKLEKPCAVVDFMYHPEADFWADHHLTAFGSKSAFEHFKGQQTSSFIYDDGAGSCAKLLWDHLYEVFAYRNDRYSEMVMWADKIDAARYESVREAIECPSPALKISLGLALEEQNGYSKSLVKLLGNRSLREVAEISAVKDRFQKAQSLLQMGLERFRHSAHMEPGGIVVFDVDGADAIVSRYAPYYFFPNARYSVGIVRWKDAAKITAMRNPWLEFPSVPLGKLFEELGGGGHRRVASVVLRQEQAAKAHLLVHRILTFIRERGLEAQARKI